MFQSKAIKEPDEDGHKESSKLYLWWIQTPVADLYYDFVHKFITKPIFQIKRLYDWQVNVFKDDYDWEAHCLFAIMEYKLIRIQKALNSGHAVQEDKDLKALKLAIKLAGRLKEDQYESIAYERFEKKWGELTSCHPPSDREGYTEWHSKFLFVVTEEDETQSRKEMLESYNRANHRMERESKVFYAILHKYLRSWWD